MYKTDTAIHEEPFSLIAKDSQAIVSLLSLEKKYQGKQIYRWIVKGATSFDDMSDLPQSLRRALSERYPSFYSSSVVQNQTDDDGNIKLALRLFDGNIVECVLLKDSEGNLTACVSSQAGCAMGCAFCRTGTLKLKRNLYSCEIAEQFMYLRITAGRDISHIVFMGMGEPMANIGNVIDSISFFHDPDGLNIGHRRITVSTCGVVPGIRVLAERKVPVKLAVSLVSAIDEKRSSIMPVNRTFNLKTLRAALLKFQDFSGRRFTFEYCMISGLNTGTEDADSLERYCRGLDVIVNLIPFNPCPELDFRTPSEEEIRNFTSLLTDRKVNYTIRVSRGRSIKGACGQLAGRLTEQ